MTPLSPEELAAAKRALKRMRGHRELSAEDVRLMTEYPKHTLEEAREIDAATSPVPIQHPGQDLGHVSGFDRIIAQERGNFHLGGNHT